MTRPTGVGMTAIAIAHGRAIETRRPDHLFSDPWATAFLTAAGWSEDRADPRVSAWVAVRTRSSRNRVRTAAEDGCRQFVLVGAGLDTRALRLTWPPGTRFFEIDTAEVLDFKARVLDTATLPAQAPAQRVPVVTDLRGDWPADLKAAGFDPTRPTAWIAEGILLYFTPAENDALVTAMSALSAPGSRFGATLVPAGRLAEIRANPDPRPGFAAVQAMWQSDAPPDPLAWLAGHHWRAQLHHPTERAISYGRGGPATLDMVAATPPRRWLLSATRLD